MSKELIDLLCIFLPFFGSLLFAFFLIFLFVDIKIKNRITIRKEWTAQPMEIFEKFFEEFILLRKDIFGYNNNPRANLRIFPTFLTTALISFIGFSLFSLIHHVKPSFLIGKDDNSLSEIYFPTTVAFIGLWLGMFWKEKKDIHTKWEYLAQLYNTLIQQPPQGAGKSDQSFSSRDSLKVALAIDALIMGMWAHRSFYDIFEEVLVDAYIHVNDIESSWNKNAVLSMLRRTGIDYSEAQSLIEKYHEHVVSLAKRSYLAS